MGHQLGLRSCRGCLPTHPIFPVPQEEPHKIEMHEPRFIYEVATVHSSGSHGAGIVTLAGA